MMFQIFSVTLTEFVKFTHYGTQNEVLASLKRLFEGSRGFLKMIFRFFREIICGFKGVSLVFEIKIVFQLSKLQIFSFAML